MVLLNLGDDSGSIAVSFPKARTYREMIDDDVRTSSFDITIQSDGDVLSAIKLASRYKFVL